MVVDIYAACKLLTKYETTATDNAVFRLHYKVTVAILVAASILICTKQYFGDPISCEKVEGVLDKIMDSYCWIQGTWTIWHKDDSPANIRQPSGTAIFRKELNAYPGLGGFDSQFHKKIYHNYYQWVPIILLMSALFFYVPRFAWKTMEGGRMHHIVGNMKFQTFDAEEQTKRVERLKQFWKREENRRENKKYAMGFIFCEILNLLNLLLQWILTNKFLNGAFSVYGRRISQWFHSTDIAKAGAYDDEVVRPMDAVFPKMAKCTYWNYGPSGAIQEHDGLCILPLNVINEKIYLLLWIWYILLFICSTWIVTYKIFTMFFRSCRRYFLTLNKQTSFSTYTAQTQICLSHKFSFGDWFVLRQMGKNLDGFTYNLLLEALAKSKEFQEEFGPA